jgi:PAS domain S-box-containing protein
MTLSPVAHLKRGPIISLSPSIRLVTPSEALPPSDDPVRRYAKSSVDPERLLQQSPIQELDLTLAIAEDEASSIHEVWSITKIEQESSKPEADPVRDARGATLSGNKALTGHVRYEHDLQFARDEIVSNVKEVQKFNEEREASEEDEQAHSVYSGRNAINFEEQSHRIDPARTFDRVMSIVEVVREPLVILDNALFIKKANRAFYRTFGYLEEDAEGHSIYALAQKSWEIPVLRTLLEKVLLNNRAYEDVEVEIGSPQVNRKTLRLNVRRLSGGEMILMSIRDVAPRRRAEVELNRVQDELRQGQKMEVVGRLAGGVAHDFNNILTGILGFSELILDSLEKKTDVFRHATEIKRASERASALTQY